MWKRIVNVTKNAQLRRIAAGMIFQALYASVRMLVFLPFLARIDQNDFIAVSTALLSVDIAVTIAFSGGADLIFRRQRGIYSSKWPNTQIFLISNFMFPLIYGVVAYIYPASRSYGLFIAAFLFGVTAFIERSALSKGNYHAFSIDYGVRTVVLLLIMASIYLFRGEVTGYGALVVLYPVSFIVIIYILYVTNRLAIVNDFPRPGRQRMSRPLLCKQAAMTLASIVTVIFNRGEILLVAIIAGNVPEVHGYGILLQAGLFPMSLAFGPMALNIYKRYERRRREFLVGVSTVCVVICSTYGILARPLFAFMLGIEFQVNVMLIVATLSMSALALALRPALQLWGSHRYYNIVGGVLLCVMWMISKTCVLDVYELFALSSFLKIVHVGSATYGIVKK